MPIDRVPMTGVSREEWLRWRREFVNASEMATVCGEASFGSLAELYAEKKGLKPPLADTGALRRGRWGEAAVFQAIADERPDWNVQRASWHIRDTERRIACTPDGYATRPDIAGIGVVQAKVIARSVYRTKWLDDPDGPLDGPATPPTQYLIQTTTERMLSEVPWAVIAVVVNGEFDWTFRLFEIEPYPALEDRILFKAAEFLREHLDRDVMPEFEPQRDAELIKHLYPRDTGSEIDLSTDNRALVAVEELTEVSAAVKRMQKTEKALKTELTGKLGENTYGRLADGRRISWKTQHRNGYAVAPADFRVLRILAQARDE